MEVGTVVRLKKVFTFGLNKGDLGVVIKKNRPGKREYIYALFKEDKCDRFSKKAEKIYLEEVGFSEVASAYYFEQVFALTEDYRKHFWEKIFERSNFIVYGWFSKKLAQAEIE